MMKNPGSMPKERSALQSKKDARQQLNALLTKLIDVQFFKGQVLQLTGEWEAAKVLFEQNIRWAEWLDSPTELSENILNLGFLLTNSGRRSIFTVAALSLVRKWVMTPKLVLLRKILKRFDRR